MSLEQTIAGLVAAANSLTGTINSKMSQIDQKVNQATDSVPGVVRDKARQSFYVDAVAGDNANSGSSASPLQDWEGVKSRIIYQFETLVFFRGGQTHIIRGSGGAYSGFIDIRGWDYETLGIPTLSMAFDDELRGQPHGTFLMPSSCAVRVAQVRLESHYEGSEELHESSGFFGRFSGTSVIILDQCEVSLKNAPLAHQYPGVTNTDFTIRSTSIEKDADSDSRGAMVVSSYGGTQYITTRLDMIDTSFIGTTLEEQFRIKPDYSNLFSNLGLGA